MAKKRLFVPELVPRDLWGRSAYQMFGKQAVWRKEIRPTAILRSKNRCEVCNSKATPLICHEKWKYDDLKMSATLTGFEIHCRKCDSVTHFGRFGQAAGNEVAMVEAINHLSLVNKQDFKAAFDLVMASLNEWNIRSQKQWSVSVTPELMQTYPALKALVSSELARGIR